MFSAYFENKSQALLESLKQNLKQEKVRAPDSKKDVKIYKEFYNFLREHLPKDFNIATGKVRNKKHLLNRNCDVLIYNKWCQNYLDLTGGYVLSDSLYAFMSLETDLNAGALKTHANMSRALKSLYATEKGLSEEELVPVYSLLLAYQSSDSLKEIARGLREITKQKEIPFNQETDMLIVLNKGLIIKDYEQNGIYRCIETGTDTLMWFYILFIEYLDRDGKFRLDLRDYIKQSAEYNEEVVPEK